MNDFTCQSFSQFNVLGGGNIERTRFFEISTLPSGYIPKDHLECLTTVVGPPLQKKENRRQAPEDTIENTSDPSISATPSDPTRPPDSNDVVGQSVSEVVVEEGRTPGLPKRPLQGTPSASNSDPKRPKRSMPVESVSLPSRHWSPRATPSASQRKSKSSGGKAFWSGYSSEDPIKIVGISDVELDLLIQNLDDKLSPSHSDPAFLHRFQQAYIHIENQQTCFTEKGLRRMADEAIEFNTYQERETILGDDDIINLRWRGGEVGKTAAEMFGILHLASLYVRNRSNFRDYDSMEIMSYDFADVVKSGIADIQTYHLPAFIARPDDYLASEHATSSVGEKKLGLTSGDLARLAFHLQYGNGINLYWDEDKVKCTNPSIGAATVETLAQLVQECHANKTRYNSISNYDCTMMFYAKTDKDFCLSPIILRDPIDKGKFDEAFLNQAIKNPDSPRIKLFVRDFQRKMISTVPLIKFLVALLISRSGEEVEVVHWRQVSATTAIRAAKQTETATDSTLRPDPAAPSGPDAAKPESRPSSHEGKAQRQVRNMHGARSLQLDSLYASPLPNNPDNLYSFDSEETGEWSPVVTPNSNTGSMESNSSLGGSAPSLIHSARSDEDALGPFTPRIHPQLDNRFDPVLDHLLDPKGGDSKPKSHQELSQLKLPTNLVRVELVSRLGSGRVYDTYAGYMTGLGVAGKVHVAVKIVNLTECDQLDGRHCQATARKSVFDEAEFYTHGLRSLQKRNLVPEFHGVWAKGETMVMVLGHAGHPMTNPDLRDIDRVKFAYRQLHDLGIIHNDVTPRHWLKGEDNNIRLIDFEGSCQVGSKELARKLEEEEVKKVTAKAIQMSANI